LDKSYSRLQFLPIIYSLFYQIIISITKKINVKLIDQEPTIYPQFPFKIKTFHLVYKKL
jgi:hypothetical protein